ncbi:hypothetical protein [Pseudotabrizicola sp. 4114]|uniref:hypothetical protein n=1 Tax=Pseudotabrizicola sp. 4114 TaxID=2817731 RepID=UPI0028673363|nr:type IV secretory pathway VirB10-like protein [Pseudorhodobacter sp. 4114]
MSAPQTNIEKQKRRHRGPLIGMIVVVLAVGLGYLWWVGYEVAESDPAQGSQTQIDSRTGDQVVPETTPNQSDPVAVPQADQPTPGVPAQNVDPQTADDLPAVDPVPEPTAPPAN